MTDELEGTAHHEAAHAVATLLLGGGLSGVTIVADPVRGSLGLTCRDLRRPLNDQAKIIVMLAGGIAQRRLCSDPSYFGDHVDRRLASTVASRIAKGDATQAGLLLIDLERRAQELVARNWPKIQALAKALLATPTLDEAGARVAAGLVRDRGQWWRPPKRAAIRRPYRR